MNVSGIDVMILAGGLGSRLKSSVADRQKVVAAVDGRPFLFYLLEQLKNIQVNKLIFCTGHMQETVVQALKNYTDGGKILFSYEDTPLGTGGAVRQAVALAEAPDVLVMNGDSFINCDLTAFCAAYYKNDRQGLMLLTEVDDVSRFGMVTLDENSRITSFCEKGAFRGQGLINAGVYLFPKRILESIPAGCLFSLEKQFFPELVKAGTLYGFSVNGDFIDIGTAESYNQAQRFFKQ